MPIPALHATRAPPSEENASRVPPVAGEAGHPVFSFRESAWPRWRRRAPGAGFSLALHAALSFAFVYLWHHMVRDLSTPEGIPVEIVSSVPGEGGKPEAGATKPDAEVQTPAPAPPPTPAPQSKPDALKEALALPALPAEAPAPPAAAPPGAPPPGSTPPVAAPDPANPKDLRPALAEPPPEPKPAASQKDSTEKPNEAEKMVEPPKPAADAPPAPAPEVLTAPEAETSVPAPSREPEPPKPAEPNRPDEAARDASASMAAALPMSSLGMPATFRAMLSSQGSSESRQYKGAVYGALARARAAMDEEARRRRMKGQAVVSIALTETGALANVSIVQSSGSAEADAFALEMVRRAAPFPAPPPGTPRSFTPAITFGSE